MASYLRQRSGNYKDRTRHILRCLSAVEFFATYAGRALDLQPLLVNAKINNDMNLRLQYIAGLGLNSMAFQGIYRTILSYRKFPEGLFVGSTGRMDALRTLL